MNLPVETIERYTGPSADGYRHADQKGRGQMLESTALPGLLPSVVELFG